LQENLGTAEQILMKSEVGFDSNFVSTFKFWSKSDKNTLQENSGTAEQILTKFELGFD
jgi:hypothetical protein